jgi:hypothetical protein
MAGARGVRGDPYDPAVDSNTARAVLRLDPAAPLTPEAVEQSFQREAWERHPSRYPDAEGRAAAEVWAATLGEARVVLLAATAEGAAAVPPAGPFTAQPTPTDATTPPASRRRLSRGAVIGIVAGAVVVLGVLTAAGIGAAFLATSAIEQSRVAAEEEAARVTEESEAAEDAEAGIDEPDEAPAESADGSAGVERIEADEAAFTFPAALEMYGDGRYAHLCGLEHLEGCWESAVFVEADCATVEIELGFSNDDDMWAPAEETRTITESDVTTGEALPVVFGNDAYDYGWLQDVRCTTAAG